MSKLPWTPDFVVNHEDKSVQLTVTSPEAEHINAAFQAVAGGVKADDTPMGCILAESDEEASLAYDYVQRHVVPAGVVTYVTQSRRTGQVLPTILYVYDLELQEGVEPQPKDGEVEGFYLMTVEEVTRAMMSGEFKPNCCLVMLDFYVRHGLVTEENERDYLGIVARLRRRLPVPVTPQGA